MTDESKRELWVVEMREPEGWSPNDADCHSDRRYAEDSVNDHDGPWFKPMRVVRYIPEVDQKDALLAAQIEALDRVRAKLSAELEAFPDYEESNSGPVLAVRWSDALEELRALEDELRAQSPDAGGKGGPNA